MSHTTLRFFRWVRTSYPSPTSPIPNPKPKPTPTHPAQNTTACTTTSCFYIILITVLFCALYIYATRLAHSYSGSLSMNIATRRCYLFTTQQISQHRGFTSDRHGSRLKSLKRNVAGSSILPGIFTTTT